MSLRTILTPGAENLPWTDLYAHSLTTSVEPILTGYLKVSNDLSDVASREQSIINLKLNAAIVAAPNANTSYNNIFALEGKTFDVSAITADRTYTITTQTSYPANGYSFVLPILNNSTHSAIFIAGGTTTVYNTPITVAAHTSSELQIVVDSGILKVFSASAGGSSLPAGTQGDLLTYDAGNWIADTTLRNVNGSYNMIANEILLDASTGTTGAPTFTMIRDDGKPSVINVNFANLSEYPGTIAWNVNMQTDLAFQAAGTSAGSNFTINSATGALALYDTDIRFFNNNFLNYETGLVDIRSGGARFISDRGSASVVAIGQDSLASGVGQRNIAIGDAALNQLLTSVDNVAIGSQALFFCKSDQNVAIGSYALNHATTGADNVAIGYNALYSLTSGNNNFGLGLQAGNNITGGSDNVFIGTAAGSASINISMDQCVFIGNSSGVDVIGSNNIGIGYLSARNISLGNNNIMIGHQGVLNDDATIRIGTAGTHTKTFISGITGVTTGGAAVTCLVDGSGQLGTISSSIRYKKNIVPMTISEKLYDERIRCVEFDYISNNQESYGLIAEQVEEVIPEIVVKNDKGQCETIQYHLLIPMLLDLVKKQNIQIQSLEKRIAVLETK